MHRHQYLVWTFVHTRHPLYVFERSLAVGLAPRLGFGVSTACSKARRLTEKKTRADERFAMGEKAAKKL